jgi:hypothetical protein
MIKIIEAMYDLANEEDRAGDKSPDKRVDLIMQRLNKDKAGRNIYIYILFYVSNTFFFNLNRCCSSS